MRTLSQLRLTLSRIDMMIRALHSERMKQIKAEWGKPSDPIEGDRAGRLLETAEFRRDYLLRQLAQLRSDIIREYDR